MSPGAGEIVGGGVAPVLAGIVAKSDGIPYILHLAALALAVGRVVTLLPTETAPSKVVPDGTGHDCYR